MATSSVYSVPSMEYSIKVNGKNYQSSTDKISFKNNYNSIVVTHKCTNQSINNYQIWVTKASETDWGLGVGVKAYENTSSLAANTNRDATITASNSIFTQGDGLYRLALCARGDIDMTWDVTEILIVLNGLIFKPIDADAVELVVNDL